MDTAEPRLSKERVGPCKTHNHEAEIRMKESPHSTALLWRLFKKSGCSRTPVYNRIFLDTNVSKGDIPQAQTFSHHTPVRPPLVHPLPLSTSHLVSAKKINFSLTRGKCCPQTEGGSVSQHIHWQTHAVWMMLSQVKGPRAYSAEEIFVSGRNHANSY